MSDLFWYAVKKIESVARYTARTTPIQSIQKTSSNHSYLHDILGFRNGSSCSVIIRIAGISGAAAVAFSAYSSHVIAQNNQIDERRKKALENGNKQHFFHTIGLILSYKAKFPIITASLFTLGILFFSVPCYLFGIKNDTRLRSITPFGGFLFIFGWLSFVL